MLDTTSSFSFTASWYQLLPRWFSSICMFSMTSCGGNTNAVLSAARGNTCINFMVDRLMSSRVRERKLIEDREAYESRNRLSA